MAKSPRLYIRGGITKTALCGSRKNYKYFEITSQTKILIFEFEKGKGQVAQLNAAESF
jgi:hypothetical protein